MFRRRRCSDDFAEEIKAHLELEADELKRDGWSDEQTRRKAKVHFGNVTLCHYCPKFQGIEKTVANCSSQCEERYSFQHKEIS